MASARCSSATSPSGPNAPDSTSLRAWTRSSSTSIIAAGSSADVPAVARLRSISSARRSRRCCTSGSERAMRLRVRSLTGEDIDLTPERPARTARRTWGKGKAERWARSGPQSRKWEESARLRGAGPVRTPRGRPRLGGSPRGPESRHQAAPVQPEAFKERKGPHGLNLGARAGNANRRHSSRYGDELSAPRLHHALRQGAAVGAGEGEGAVERGLHLRRQRFLKASARAQMAGLDRGGNESERFRRLLDAKALDLAQDEDQAEIVGQAGDRLLEQGAHLAARQLGVRGRPFDRSTHELFPIFVDEGDRRGLELRPPPFRGPDAPERLIDRDSGQPGGEGGAAFEGVEGGEGAKVGGLDGVLGR